MAYNDTHGAHFADLPQRVFDGLKSFFSMTAAAMATAASASRKVHIVEELNEKSDAELAQMGIQREDIVRYVFRDLMDN